MIPRPFKRRRNGPCRSHSRATAHGESAQFSHKLAANRQLPGAERRFDGMRPDYLEREPKATWAEIMAPAPSAQVSRVLQRAFVVPEPAGDEWDRLLARIP